MIELKNIRGEWDHDNLQSYEPEQVQMNALGYVLMAERCEKVYPPEHDQQQLRIKGKQPYYEFKSGRLITDFCIRPPFVVKLFCDIPQVRGIVPGMWVYKDHPVREVDGFEADHKSIYFSAHDSWEPGHEMLFHKKIYARCLPKLNYFFLRVGNGGIQWRWNGRWFVYETHEFGEHDYRFLLTLAVTEPIKKQVVWNIYHVEIIKL